MKAGAPWLGGEQQPPTRLEIPRERLFQDWGSARDRLRAYLRGLAVAEPERTRLAEQAIERAATEPEAGGGDALAAGFAALRRLLVERHPRAIEAPQAGEPDLFAGWRIDVVLAGGIDAPAPEPARRAGRRRLYSMPPHERRSFVAHRFVRRGLRRSIERAPGAGGVQPEPARPAALPERRRRWRFTALRRRLLLALLVLIPSVIAGGFMLTVLPERGGNWLEAAIAVCFGALFGWISIGFWTATLGFGLLLLRRDRFAVTRLPPAPPGPGGIDPAIRTAIVMPICEEPVPRVFAGLRAIHRSLEKTGLLDRFDFFVLSDTRSPDRAVEEEAAWFDFCREVGGFGRIFYRRRRVRLERKAGNVADFCRRWGNQYRYMVMLDADSVMSGTAITRLVAMMEAHPEAGMIQTAPVAALRRSLFARVQQFASRLYSPLFAAGLHYWQLGEGQYWGHNTIIRVAPFMECCHLPRLPGKPPFGGEILSHDFVEAALMGRAGWTLWLAYDLEGSWEEVPSNLLEEMARDRRWCQGNIQHLRLFFTEGLRGAHRALFLNGVLSYVSAGLWFCFLALSTSEAIWQALREPVYFPPGPSLFPEWPVWRPDWALALAGVTAAILFLPKLLAILLVVLRGRAREFGGLLRLLPSALLEVLISTLLAPIRMVFHTRFVFSNLLGRTVSWSSPPRGDRETSWREALRFHAFDTVWASAWAASVFALNPGYFWWLTPIVAALVLAVPVSVLTSRIALGERTRKAGLFLIPEEWAPPPELVDVERETARAESARAGVERDGFVRAVVDPVVNAVHCALLGGTRGGKPSLRAARHALVERALAQGPDALGPGERRLLLADLEPMIELHRGVWQLADRARAARWGVPAS